MTVFPKIMKQLEERGATDIVVVGGGVIQADDIPKLTELGVRGIFDADATTQDLIDGIERIVREHGRQRSRAQSYTTAP